jgi:hypothetical protein
VSIRALTGQSCEVEGLSETSTGADLEAKLRAEHAPFLESIRAGGKKIRLIVQATGKALNDEGVTATLGDLGVTDDTMIMMMVQI